MGIIDAEIGALLLNFGSGENLMAAGNGGWNFPALGHMEPYSNLDFNSFQPNINHGMNASLLSPILA